MRAYLAKYEPHLYLLFLRKESKGPWKMFNEMQRTTHWPHLRCGINMQRHYRISQGIPQSLDHMDNSHVNPTFYSTICKKHWSVTTWEGSISWCIGRWRLFLYPWQLALIASTHLEELCWIEHTIETIFKRWAPKFCAIVGESWLAITWLNYLAQS